MSIDPLLAAVQSGVRIFDLGWPLFVGMPQSPNHPKFRHSFPRLHGEVVRPDGSSSANDLLVMGTHVGTHIDALGHVSHQGLLFGGQAAVVDDSGGFSRHGVHMIPPMVRRGVLLDVPPTLGREVCEAAYLITPDDLDAAVRQQGIEIRAADIVLIRTGWGRRFAQGAEEYLGVATGVPGIGEAGARWLVDRHVHAVGSDTIAFEHLSPGGGHRLLPVHRMLLVDAGTYIIEALSLEELADARVFEFTIVLVPLKIVGATGSPVRPLAVVADD